MRDYRLLKGRGGKDAWGDWQNLSTSQRCRTIAGVASQIALNSQNLIELCQSPWRVDPVETITAELFPLCAALKWIGRRGSSVLADKYYGAAGRPAWLWGVQSRVRRVPMGKVLILAAWNYPLFLPGVQTAQALAAGNSVLLKPAPGCEAVTSMLVDAFYAAGVPNQALIQLDSEPQAARDAIDSGVDLVVLTGGAETGQKVMAHAAQTLTPTIMELSGCDSVIVHPDADLDRAARAIAFGMQLSSGATCIAPRRVFAESETADELRDLILFYLQDSQPMHVHPSSRSATADAIENAFKTGSIDVGSRMNAAKLRDQGEMYPTLLDRVTSDLDVACQDLFAPLCSLIRVDDINDSVAIINQSQYRLSASVFAPDDIADVVSEQIAEKLQVGSVAINDLIVPTADPRVPFGGRGRSGFGVTRGAEGLLSMTAAQVIGHHHGNFMPHLRRRQAGDGKLLQAALVTAYAARWKDRFAAIRRMAGKG